ncbi:FHA domain-containing protein [Aliiglaciecola sp. LCG003]|uniref:FHA domain-containing protein n=1 Tax=Aliiglaciecola sp. LCG003 TaxID=3053655 RepID=UPI002573DFCC|nr:FHA domain-containing protein [Aliiglaciecola sp. LCG003]WJG07780.1 FHA domain-containing protein [Aliiglaciecola sp. LCG003]
MAIVVEILSRDGKVIQHYYIDKPTVAIGRAYDNDVRIDDPYVCPHHVSFNEQLQSQQLRIDSNGSLNGVKVNGIEVEDGQIGYSDVITLGRTRLRIFSHHQDVPAALPLSELEENIEWLSLRRVCAGLFTLFIGLISMKYFLNSINQIDLAVVIKVAMTVAATASIWPLAFALLSKLAKQDSHIISQFSLLWIFLISSELLDYIEAFLQFNSSATQIVYWSILTAKGILFFALLWFALFLAFHQSKPVRNAIAAVGTVIISIYVLSPYLFTNKDFNQNPSYVATVLTPTLRIADTTSTESFVESSDKLFKRLSSDIEQEK